jgi:hypothetical protein
VKNVILNAHIHADFMTPNYQVGDLLVLKETQHTGEEMRQGAPLQYTGRQVTRRITHIQTGYGLLPGWAILSVEKV